MMRYIKKPGLLALLIGLATLGISIRAVNLVAVDLSVNMALPEIAMFETADAATDSHVKPQEAILEKTPEEETAKAIEAPENKKPPAAHIFSSSEIEVLQSLAQRRDVLVAREKQLARREALLKAADQEVENKIAELNKLQSQMKQLLGEQQEAEEKQIKSLVKIYENMKPKDAARIFDSLEMNILLDVIDRMSERKASPVLANMNPEKAKDVTIRLAEHRRLPSQRIGAKEE